MESNATPIPMRTVDSKVFDKIGYDPVSNRLAVQFKPRAKQIEGAVYHFENVDAEMFDRFNNAPSHGDFFFAHIKPNPAAYPFTKVSGAVADPDQAAA